MNFCANCNNEFQSLREHIIKFHKPLADPNNKGNILCELCNIRVKNLYKHRFSVLHRFNQDLNSLIFFHSPEEFLDHFNQLKDEKEIDEILNFNEENQFWITARKELDEEQYKQLKGELIGKQRKPNVRKRRNNRYWYS